MVRRITPALTAVFTPLLALSANTLADEYQWELGASYEEGDFPSGDSQNSALSGTYYFNPVNTEGHVLAEAAFLERASNVSVTGSRSNTDFFTSGLDVDRDTFNLRAELYLPGDLFYAALQATRYDHDVSGTDGQINDDGTQWQGSLGITPMPGLLISSNFHEDQDLDEDWNLGAKYVNRTLALTARYYDDRGSERLSLGLDYYLNKTLSIGVKRTNYMGSSDDNYQLNARKFITDRWSVSAHYQEFDESDSFGVGTRIRF